MNKLLIKSLSIVLVCLSFETSILAQRRIVDKYGKLQVKGSFLMSEYGDTVQLRGMALFWSQWMGQYYNKQCVRWLKEDWKCTIVRAGMGVEMGGYLENPDTEIEKIDSVVLAAIDEGIYVLIDYHSHEAHKNPDAAIRFFGRMAKRYGKYPHVIYELFNEPLNVKWEDVLKPYAEKVIAAIRKNDPDNLIIMGCRSWSQMVSEAVKSKINDSNIAYSMHFYADTHKDWLRKETEAAILGGLCVFVTEFGTCDASGNGGFNPTETRVWLDFMDKHKISWCNWSVSDKEETASVIKKGSSGLGGWTSEELTPSGKLIRDELRLKNGAALAARGKRKEK